MFLEILLFILVAIILLFGLYLLVREIIKTNSGSKKNTVIENAKDKTNKRPESKSIGKYYIDLEKGYKEKLEIGEKVNTWNKPGTSLVYFFERGSVGGQGKIGEIKSKSLSKKVSEYYIDGEIISVKQDYIKVNLYYRI